MKRSSIHELSPRISYWLVPIEKHREKIAKVIKLLAQEYDSAHFDPHVTIYCGLNSILDNHQTIADLCSEDISPLELSPIQISYSKAFTKSLFIELEYSCILSHLHKCIHDLISVPSDYLLEPHLSLMYKSLPLETLHELSLRMNPIFTEEKLTFDKLKVIANPAKVKCRTDVEYWYEVASKQLH